jgi:hypothetical protein
MPHETGRPAAHVPAPSQRLTVSSPSSHTEPHSVDSRGYAQLAPSWPSQLPAQIPLPAHASRSLRGSPSTGLHSPSLPGSPHASHWPSHSSSQQTPSTQKPKAHSLPSSHGSPGSLRGAQLPPGVQKAVVESHSASVVQLVLQASPEQVYGAHGTESMLQLPEPLHTCPLTVSFVHIVSPHCVPRLA